MVCVDVHRVVNGRDAVIGRLCFDGRSIVVEPPNDPFLRKLLLTRLRAPDDVILTAAESPEAWLKSLHLKYNNAYCRVTPVKGAA